jgi:hypothetical protein
VPLPFLSGWRLFEGRQRAVLLEALPNAPAMCVDVDLEFRLPGLRKRIQASVPGGSYFYEHGRDPEAPQAGQLWSSTILPPNAGSETASADSVRKTLSA